MIDRSGTRSHARVESGQTVAGRVGEEHEWRHFLGVSRYLDGVSAGMVVKSRLNSLFAFGFDVPSEVWRRDPSTWSLAQQRCGPDERGACLDTYWMIQASTKT